jgi:hypothetical protein
MTGAWIIATLAVIAVNVADILSTKAFLALGIEEKHKWWRWAQATFNRFWGVPKMLISMGVTAVGWWQDALLVPLVLAAGLAGVVLWNVWQIRKAGR